MNVIAEIHRINERELELGVPYEGSWHQKYKESAWVYVGGLPYELTEGDVICVLSQFGEIEDINLVRDGKTGKSKGFAFIKYENQRSTVLAVDNMNGARILERVIRVDHVLKYKLPKEIQDREDAKENALTSDEEGGGGDGDDATKTRRGLPGHAYEGKELDGKYDISHGHNVFAAPEESKKERKQRKKEEKKHKKHARKVQKIEAKQAKLFEEIQKKRKTQREQELRDLQRKQREDADESGAPAVEASSTGWRGRLEPNAPRANARRAADRGGGGDHGGRDKFKDGDDASYGGLKRTR